MLSTNQRLARSGFTVAGALLVAACATQAPPREASSAAASVDAAAPYASMYQPGASRPMAIVGGHVLLGNGQEVAGGTVLVENGRIKAVMPSGEIPDGFEVVDASGRWVTPGVIDMHSHNGAGPAPNVEAHGDFNEEASPVGAENWVEHSVLPLDASFRAAREAGVTSLLILPGSANPIGGRGVVLKNVPARSVYEMKFPGAPQGLKIACGENPKRVWGERNQAPGTRMGEMAVLRQILSDAERYRDERKRYEDGDGAGARPRRDLRMETLAALLEGSIDAQIHCYRSDDMINMIELSKEFGFRIAAFHHALDAYKIRDHLKERDICTATWADRWGPKMEMLDGIRETPAMIHADGGCVAMHSDSEITGQRLNQEAGKAMAAGRRMGIDITPAQAMRWLSLNPAQAIGIGDQTGSLEPGKMADIVVWSRNPFSSYVLADLVLVDGAVTFDRSRPQSSPPTDIELGSSHLPDTGK